MSRFAPQSQSTNDAAGVFALLSLVKDPEKYNAKMQELIEAELRAKETQEVASQKMQEANARESEVHAFEAKTLEECNAMRAQLNSDIAAFEKEKSALEEREQKHESRVADFENITKELNAQLAKFSNYEPAVIPRY